VRALALAVPFVRELDEVRCQFVRPYVLDSQAAQETFGLAPTPIEDGLAAHVRWWAQRQEGADRARTR
jgi:nucleoside-diphosphate-sugar epimerase